MTQLTSSLVLTGDASSLVAAVNRSEAVLDRLIRSSQTTSQGMKSARDSATVFEAALNEQRGAVTTLATGYEEVARAGRTFEQQQTTLKHELDTGALDAREYDAALTTLTQQHRQAAAAAELQANATGRLTTATNGGSGGLQNFSYQLQDVFTQVGMGVPLLVSLGQQAPQMLSGFGQVGAIAGVAAAAILPLTAAMFGLGYAGRKAADDIKTSAEQIEGALSAIGTAQTVLKGNTLTELDQIAQKYGQVTASVLTLMQAQNRLAVSDALAATRDALASAFEGNGVAELFDHLPDRETAIADLRNELSSQRAYLEIAVDKAQVRRTISELETDLRDMQSGLDLELDFGVDQSDLQDVLIFQKAIESALGAENFQGALTVVTQMREALQGIPDGPLSEMLAGVVASEDALRQALAAAELNEETFEEIEALLSSISGIDVGKGVRDAKDEAEALATALDRASSIASGLASSGAATLEDARLKYQFRDDPVRRAEALAAARYDRSVPALGQDAPDGIRTQIADDRKAYVDAARAAAEYDQALRDATQTNRSGGASSLARDYERAVASIERDLARLAPSYERDVEAIEAWRDESLAALDPARAGYQSFADDVALIYDVKLADAYLRDLERRTDWAAGVERGLLKTQERMMTFADFSEDLVDTWSEGLEDAFIELNRTGKAEIGDLVDYTADQFMRLAFQKTIQPGLDIGFDFLTGALGGLFGATQSHAGSTIGTGGVRRSYGPGAPLRADERLTVTTMGQRVFTPEQISNGATVVDALATAAQANQSGGAVVFAPQINVENQSSASVSGQMEETTDRSGQRSYKLVLADEVGQALARKGGGARQQMQRGYGLTKPGVKR